MWVASRRFDEWRSRMPERTDARTRRRIQRQAKVGRHPVLMAIGLFIVVVLLGAALLLFLGDIHFSTGCGPSTGPC